MLKYTGTADEFAREAAQRAPGTSVRILAPGEPLMVAASPPAGGSDERRDAAGSRGAHVATREQANTRIVLRAMEEVFTAANVAAVDELYAPDFVNHVPPSLGAEVRGRKHVKQFAAHWRRALPDLVHQVEDVRTDRDMVIVRWRARGTHRGRMWGVGPTGLQLEVPAFELSRVLDARIVEQWLALDTLGLAQQLGLAPRLKRS